MPVIELSNNAGLTAYNNAFAYDSGPRSGGLTGGGLGASYEASGFLKSQFAVTVSNAILICKGTRPTTLQSLYTSFTPDILVKFDPGTHYGASNANGPVQSGVTGTTFWIDVKTALQNASATGVATYFAIVTWQSSTNAIYQQTTGSVGLVGSGADMEITDTNIVSGSLYRVVQLRFEVPLVWSY